MTTEKAGMRMRNKELGGARLKLVIALAIIAIIGYAGYLYIPVAVDAYYFKDTMHNKVNLAAAQGYDPSWVTDQLSKSKAEFHVPDDAVITPAQKDGRMEVRVQYTRPISTPLFTYNYDFDYTAQSNTFLVAK
jgi:hypothetical protein